MKQKFVNLITALHIAEGMPTHPLKAKQIRSFFEDIGKLDLPQGLDIIYTNTYENGKYHFCYINHEMSFEFEAEASVNDTSQVLIIHKEKMSLS
jgi:hypothetical protein